jgi:hypothetical protein
MEIKEFIKQLITGSGVDVNAEEIKKLLDLNIEGVLPESFTKAFNSKYLTQESARNDASVQAHYKSKVLGEFDEKINDIVKSLGLNQDQLTSILGVKKSEERIRAMIEAAKVPGTADIATLNKQIAEMKAQHEQAIKDLTTQHTAKILNGKIENWFASQEWSDAYPEQLRTKLALLQLAEMLNQKGAVAVLSENGEDILLKSKADSSMDFFMDNRPVKFHELGNLVMETNKFKKVVPAQNSVIPVVTSETQLKLSMHQQKLQDSIKQSLADQGVII